MADDFLSSLLSSLHSSPLQIDPNAHGLLQAAVGPESIPPARSPGKTQKYRTAIRGQDRMSVEAKNAANAYINGEQLSPFHSKLLSTVIGKYVLGKAQEYNTPERWEIREMVTNPAINHLAKFDDKGNLSNVDQMRVAYAQVLRQRIANPNRSEQDKSSDQDKLLSIMKKISPSWLLGKSGD